MNDIKYSLWISLFSIQLMGFIAMFILLPGHATPHQHQEVAEHPAYAPLYNKIKNTATDTYWEGVRQQTTAHLSNPQVLKTAFNDIIRHEVKDFIAPYLKGYVTPVWKTVSIEEQQQAYELVHEWIDQNVAAGGWSPEDVAKLGAYTEKLNPTQRSELIELYLKNQPPEAEEYATGKVLLPPPL